MNKDCKIDKERRSRNRHCRLGSIIIKMVANRNSKREKRGGRQDRKRKVTAPRSSTLTHIMVIHPVKRRVILPKGRVIKNLLTERKFNVTIVPSLDILPISVEVARMTNTNQMRRPTLQRMMARILMRY